MHKVDWRSQDAGMALAPLDRRKTQALFAVFDGESNHDVATADRESDGLFINLRVFEHFNDKHCVLTTTGRMSKSS